MWTSTMDRDLKKVLLTRIVGRFYRDIYFSSYSPLQVQNLARQSLPESSWVRVRNRLSGISGSDLHQLYAYKDPLIAPAAAPNHTFLYPGHEVVGEVIEIGDTVQRLHVGDRVVLQNSPNCITAAIQPRCRACLLGNYNLCEHGAFIARQTIGGGWSEEMLLHEQQLFPIPVTMSDEQAVMLEPTAIALHAVLRHIPKPGERVLIIGAGTIGLLTLQILKALAPQAEISVMARYPFQVERATRLGSSHIIYPRDAYAGVQQATKSRMYHGMFGNSMIFGGYDTIFDTVGRKKTLHNALRWTRAQGTIVLVGIDMHFKHIDLSPIWYQEINLLGSTAHGMEQWPLGTTQQTSTYHIAVELMEQKRIAPEQFITHHFALNNYKNALLTATNKTESRAIKVIFDYSLLPASVVPNVRASAPRRRRSTVDFSNYVDDLDDEVENGQADASQMQEMHLTPQANSLQPYTTSVAQNYKQDSPSQANIHLSLHATRTQNEENEELTLRTFFPSTLSNQPNSSFQKPVDLVTREEITDETQPYNKAAIRRAIDQVSIPRTSSMRSSKTDLSASEPIHQAIPDTTHYEKTEMGEEERSTIERMGDGDEYESNKPGRLNNDVIDLDDPIVAEYQEFLHVEDEKQEEPSEVYTNSQRANANRQNNRKKKSNRR